jgi:VIT1/CCC1 family predicted Fe2+/Mn2+ transporter
MSEAELESLRNKLISQAEVPAGPRLTVREWLGGPGVFLAVFLSTFPVAAPFLFIPNARNALRVSNAIALLMLFLTGYAFGRYAHYRPWKMGLSMALFGVLLVAITIYLGG